VATLLTGKKNCPKHSILFLLIYNLVKAENININRDNVSKVDKPVDIVKYESSGELVHLRTCISYGGKCDNN